MAHRHDVLTGPPTYASTAFLRTSKLNNSTRSPRNSALSSAVALLLVNCPITHQVRLRPVGPHPTFNTVDVAQKCIDILRSHHNLHPTFAKVSHSFHPVLSHLTLPHPSFPFDPTQTHKIARSPPLINITNPHPSAAAYVPELALAHSTSHPHLDLGSSTSTSSIGMTMGIGGAVGGYVIGGEEVGGDVYIEDSITTPRPKTFVTNSIEGRLGDIVGGCRSFADEAMAPHQQDTNNNVGSSGNVHNATGARRGYPNTNVNANGNGIGGGSYQSQSQSPEGVATGGVGGLDRMSMGGGYEISVEPLLHILQGHDPTHTRHWIHNSPAPLQPISATLSQLQMQLESLRPLLAAYTNSSNTNANSDATSNGTTTNNGTNTNLHSHNAQSQSHSNPTSPHLQSVPIPNGNSHPNLAATAASNTLNGNPNTNTNTKAFNPHRASSELEQGEGESESDGMFVCAS
ncbi:hypothetical protein M422DRAFT_258491 [Sphaerobolus stellatus SS14]|uniref:Uncharacterized protein n=1 Tax=Sphaerobolus stellatus (strain SS14) TaxID=990650 RepID=A0A0C9UVH6_SPHS4|nr:hypothetical protein M422DRAFT_258491 [Sphaerobolus stellatus SS14]